VAATHGSASAPSSGIAISGAAASSPTTRSATSSSVFGRDRPSGFWFFEGALRPWPYFDPIPGDFDFHVLPAFAIWIGGRPLPHGKSSSWDSLRQNLERHALYEPPVRPQADIVGSRGRRQDQRLANEDLAVVDRIERLRAWQPLAAGAWLLGQRSGACCEKRSSGIQGQCLRIDTRSAGTDRWHVHVGFLYTTGSAIAQRLVSG